MEDKDGAWAIPTSAQDETDTTQETNSPRHMSGEDKKIGLAKPIHPALEQTQSDDIEGGNEQHAARSWLRRVLKHWRHPFYALIWLLFTG